MAADIDDDEILKQVKAQISVKFPNVPDAHLDEIIREEFDAIADRPVRDFLDVLTTRAVKQRLRHAKS